MNAKLREEITKALGIDKEIAKQGKWIKLGNTKVSFLVRPATVHNKDFQSKLIENKNYELFDRIKADKNLLKNDKNERLAFADLLLGTIILDIKKEGLSKEDLGTLEIDDLEWFMTEYEEDFSVIINMALNRETFQIVTDAEAKN